MHESNIDGWKKESFNECFACSIRENKKLSNKAEACFNINQIALGRFNEIEIKIRKRRIINFHKKHFLMSPTPEILKER